MDNFIVDTDTCTCGETHVTEEGGTSPVLLDKLTDSLIEILRGNSLTDKSVSECERFSRQTASGTHQLQLLGIFDNDHTLNTESRQGEGGGVFHFLLTFNQLEGTRLSVVILQGLGGFVVDS